MLETTSRDEINPSERMPQALMLFGEDKVTPVGYSLMQGDREISRGSFPIDIHTGPDRYDFLQKIEHTAREEWSKGQNNPKKIETKTDLRVYLGNRIQELRRYLQEIIESLSPATWEAMT